MSKVHVSLALLSFLMTSALAQAGGPNAEPLPQGCVAHTQAVEGGEIDWGGGYIVAIGRGEAKGTSDQDRQMARRAAEVVAARNVLAVACGVRVDADGCLADVRNGEVQLRGVLKGHEVISVDWRPNEHPPVCFVRMRAPLWGAKGAASIVYDSMCAKARRGNARRLPLVAPADTSIDEVLVIDARGLRVEPCMFPSVTIEDGAILYDVATITDRRASPAPPVRFVETRMSFEELRCDASMPLSSSSAALGFTNGAATILCSLSPAPMSQLFAPPVTSRPTSAPAATQPADEDDGTSRRRKRRVVKALKTGGANNTQIVLTKEDAEKLRQNPEAAAALKSGRVVVVVDSVAAGIEGRAPETWIDGVLALADHE